MREDDDLSGTSSTVESEYLFETRRRLEGMNLETVCFRDLFGDVDDAYLAWLLAESRVQVPEMAALLPALPSVQVQASFTGLSGQAGFQAAVAVYSMCRSIAEELGVRPADGNCRAIDFGCGWGRISQVMLRDVRPENLVAADVWQEALDHCRESGLPCNLLKVEPWPPMAVAAESIDLIVAYSVFSHLSEENHWAWLEEFHRVLRPGGVVALTTRSRSFIEYVATLRRAKELPLYGAGAARVFMNTQEVLRRYDRGEFCFDAAGRGGGVLVGFYGEACIPRQYVEKRWSGLFGDTRFVAAEDHGKFDQTVLVARK